MEKEWRWYLAEYFPKFPKNLFWRTLAVKPFWWSQVSKNCRDTLWNENKLPPRYFSCQYIRIFSAFSEGSNMNSVYAKTAGCELQGHNFIKMLVHHSLSSENIMFKTASFRYVFQRESAKKSVYSRAAIWICTLEAFNFTERNSIIDIFMRIAQFFASNFFSWHLFCQSSSNLHLHYIKVRCEALEEVWPASSSTLSSLIQNISWKRIRKQNCALSILELEGENWKLFFGIKPLHFLPVISEYMILEKFHFILYSIVPCNTKTYPKNNILMSENTRQKKTNIFWIFQWIYLSSLST